MNHPAIDANFPVLGEHVIDRSRHHLCAYRLRIIAASGLDGVQVISGCRVDACRHHARHLASALEVALSPGAALIVHVPVPASGQHQPLSHR
ncbi:hypothetical protein D3C84_873540 [compost metagenome]